jgi:hypothetical protein
LVIVESAAAMSAVRDLRARPRLGRHGRPVAFALTVAILGFLVFELTLVLPRMLATPGTMSVDFHQYQEHARRWLAGGGLYLPAQLAGPYAAWDLLPPLYPPTFLLLIVPFLWLPEVLWWAIPLAIVTAVVVHWRPSPWTWPLMALCVAWPRTWELVGFGNPAMWIVAAVALGTVLGWPAVAVLLKPSLFPFALIGANRRSWWLALGVAVLLCLPFGAMWLDWFRALTNATDTGLGYSVKEIPALLIPVVAWLGRSASGLHRIAE